MHLLLGCGLNRLAGFTHVDVRRTDGVDVVWDLNQRPWPWEDNTARFIMAEDVVEHLSISLIDFCDEAWRVIKPGGELFVRTPHHKGDSSWIDPTHRWHLDERAFQYLDPVTYFGRTYLHYTARKWKIILNGVRGPSNIHALLMPRK